MPSEPGRLGAERIRLTDATRALIEAVAAVAPDDEVASTAAADAIEAVAASLRTAADPGDARRGRRRPGDPSPSSLLVGPAHPLSPGATWTFADGVVDARVTFGAAYQGPPGSVHGGVLALAFDELFGLATVLDGRGALTGKLTVRYRHPTPLHRELRLTGRVEHRSGRRVRTRGTIHAGELLTAEAEGLFVARRPDGPTPDGGDPPPRRP